MTPRWVCANIDLAISIMAKRYLVSKRASANLPPRAVCCPLKNSFHHTVFNVLFVRSLASRLPTPTSEVPSLTVTAVNPGWCKSELLRELKGSLQVCDSCILFHPHIFHGKKLTFLFPCKLPYFLFNRR